MTNELTKRTPFDWFPAFPRMADLMRWEQPQMERFFSENQTWSPRVELTENENDFVVTAELPGCKADEIKVTLTGGTLTIQGEKRSEEKREEDNVHITERSYGSYSRSFTFPSPVDSDAVSAENSDGVLTVKVKKAESTKSRKIDVQAK